MRIRCSCTADEGSSNQQEEHDNALFFPDVNTQLEQIPRLPWNGFETETEQLLGVQNCCVMITIRTASGTECYPVIEVYVALHCNVMAYRISNMTKQCTTTSDKSTGLKLSVWRSHEKPRVRRREC